MKGTGSDTNYSVCIRTPYQQLAYQLFGNPVDSSAISAHYFYKGPFVSLSSGVGKKLSKAKERNIMEEQSCNIPEGEINIKTSGRCLICYSVIDLGQEDKSNQIEEQFGSTKKEEGGCSDFLDFIRILTSGKEELGHVSARFHEAIRCLSSTDSLKRFCHVCHSASQQVLLKQQTLLKLQQQINELQKKFVAAIQASTALAEKELVDPLSTGGGGEDEDDEPLSVRLHRENVNVVRKCLLDRGVKPKRKRGSAGKTPLVFLNTESDEQNEERRLEEKLIECFDDWQPVEPEELFGDGETNSFIITSDAIDVKLTVDGVEDPILSDVDCDALASDNSIVDDDGDGDSAWEPPSSPEITTTGLSARAKRHSPRLSPRAKKEMAEVQKQSRQDRPRATTSDRSFDCQFCDLSYTRKDHLNRHMQSRHSELKPFRCEHCDESYEMEAELREHVKQHRGEPFKCQFCPKAYYGKKTLNIHMRQKHPEEAKELREAQRQRPKMKRIRKPAKKHVPCTHCDRLFISKSAMETHARSHTGERPFVCHICSKAFYEKKGMDFHVQIVHEGIRPHVCEQCGKCFGRRSNLASHYLEVHAEVKPYTCEHCGKGFGTKKHIAEHVRSHLGERPYACHMCPKAYYQKKSLNEHMQKHHPDQVDVKIEIRKKPRKEVDERFTCKYCGKMFVSPSALTNHVRTHTGERPFNCTICSRGFAELQTMKRHVRVAHHAVKPHVCDQCHRSFARKDYLKAHFMIHHSGVKPFSCDRCDRTFGTSSHLKKHIRSHLGQRNHSCNYCPKAYYQKQHLREHLQKHHPEEAQTLSIIVPPKREQQTLELN